MNKGGIMKLKSKINIFVMPLPFYFLLFTIVGCTSLKENARGFLGLSTKALEEARSDAITRTFNYDYAVSYDKVKAALKEIGSYIYAQDKQRRMIAAYVSEYDTTPVGLFFKEIDAGHTEIQVSSQSTYAKEAVAKDVFSVLDGTYKPKEEKGNADAK
jgi:hypothetical protein